MNLEEVKGMNRVVVSRRTVGRKCMGSNPWAVVFVRFLNFVRELKPWFQFVVPLNGRVDW